MYAAWAAAVKKGKRQQRVFKAVSGHMTYRTARARKRTQNTATHGSEV
jgi:hypothetical protein